MTVAQLAVSADVSLYCVAARKSLDGILGA